ncbi:MAG: TetR/AcrR family transcriptional regulator [Desulfobacteraceae bacterium]|nr:MAG: TetR/AcrR family transcriptional regulator [Desulfobacteraceae bacterium]
METQTLKEKQGETIRRILDAAGSIFSEVGFAGARMDEIAKRAQVNKATIYYHIGDKKALYAEVLHDITGSAFERSLREVQDAQSPEEKLKTYIRSVTNNMDQHPHLAPIIMREQASGGQNLPEVIARVFADIIAAVNDILEEGEREGVFIKTIPFIVHSMVIGCLMFYKASDPIRSKYAAFPEALKKLDKKVSGGVADELEKLVLRAVKK